MFDEESEMESFHESMLEYRRQLEKGAIQEAYRELMDYFNALRSYFKKKYSDHHVSGGVYYGYMDMTYFSFSPKSLKHRKLKIAIVFVHEAFRFEVWLAASNRTVQTEYWKLFNERDWEKYHIATPAKGVDAILDHVLVDCPDFRDLNALTKQIENGTLKFIEDIETFLANQ
jgi:hypothetical protein